MVSRLLLGDFLAPITRLKRAYCTPKNTTFRRRKGAELVPILRRQLNLGADLVPIRCLFLGAPETRRKIGAYCDLRSGWDLAIRNHTHTHTHLALRSLAILR